MSEQEIHALVLDNTGLIEKAIRDLHLCYDIEEYKSIGMLALVTAANKFDPSRGLKPSTYLYACIRGQLLLELSKSADRRKHTTGFECPEDIEDDEDQYTEEIDSNMIKCMRTFVDTKLSPRQRLFFLEATGIFGAQKKPMAVIAKEHNVPYSTVASSVSRIKDSLKQYMLDAGYTSILYDTKTKE